MDIVLQKKVGETIGPSKHAFTQSTHTLGNYLSIEGLQVKQKSIVDSVGSLTMSSPFQDFSYVHSKYSVTQPVNKQ